LMAISFVVSLMAISFVVSLMAISFHQLELGK
jgi:hypothetical protein